MRWPHLHFDYYNCLGRKKMRKFSGTLLTLWFSRSEKVRQSRRKWRFHYRMEQGKLINHAPLHCLCWICGWELDVTVAVFKIHWDWSGLWWHSFDALFSIRKFDWQSLFLRSRLVFTLVLTLALLLGLNYPLTQIMIQRNCKETNFCV